MLAPLVRSAAPTPMAELLRPGRALTALWGHRDLIRQFIAREVLLRHRGSVLGMAWALVQPLVTLAIYTLVFSVVLQVRWEHASPPGPPPNVSVETGGGGGAGGAAVPVPDDRAWFALMMLAGLMIYNIMSETVQRAPGLVLEHPNYVKKVVFPLEILPVASLGAALVFSAFSLAVLVLGRLLLIGGVPMTALLLPVVLIPLILLTLAAGWFLASLGVFLRDTRQVVGIAVGQVLFFMTPIFYPIERVPDSLRMIIRANPMTPIVESARNVLLLGRAPLWPELALWTVLASAGCVGAYAWFMKSKRGFADVL